MSFAAASAFSAALFLVGFALLGLVLVVFPSSLPLLHRFAFVRDQSEVELAAFEVGTVDFDAHLVAQGIAFVVTAAHETIVALIEFIIVVEQGAERNHAFAEGFRQFHIEAKLRDTGDAAIELLPDAVAHEFHLFVFDGSTFGVGCNLFHI